MIYDRLRARLVANQGFQRRKGIDYLHSFSPTASYVTIRLIMALTAIAGFFSYDLDATLVPLFQLDYHLKNKFL